MSFTSAFAGGMASQGGGGSTILRATGTLQAYTSPAQTPPPIVYILNAVPEDSDTLVFSSTRWEVVTFTFSSVGTTGSIDTSSGDLGVIAGLIVSQLAGSFSAGNVATITDPSVGSSASLVAVQTPASISASGGGSGSDALGGITFAELVPAAAGQSIKIIAAYYDGAIAGMNLALSVSGSPISLDGNAGSFGAFSPAQGALPAWIDGSAGSDLGVQFTTDLAGLPTDGSTCYVEVIYQQL